MTWHLNCQFLIARNILWKRIGTKIQRYSDIGSAVLSLNTKQIFLPYLLLNTYYAQKCQYILGFQISMQFATFPMTSYLLRHVALWEAPGQKIERLSSFLHLFFFLTLCEMFGHKLFCHNIDIPMQLSVMGFFFTITLSPSTYTNPKKNDIFYQQSFLLNTYVKVEILENS